MFVERNERVKYIAQIILIAWFDFIHLQPYCTIVHFRVRRADLEGTTYLVSLSVCTCSSLKLLFCVWHLVVITIEMQCHFAVFMIDARRIQQFRRW